MLLTKKVEIKVGIKTFKYYKNMGYSNIKLGDKINVDINLVTKGSHVMVDVQCDICKSIKKIKYFKYLRNFNRQKYYTCSQKCGSDKRKITNQKIYGEDSYTKTDAYKNNFIKYSMEKYGYKNPFQSEIIKDKSKLTTLKKYGVENVMYNTLFINKILKTKIDSGLIFNIKEDEFSIYKKIIRKITDKNKKIIFENWNGYDYYDNEYIKDNFNLNHNDPLYPTIDHKISITYGYINNISPDIISSTDNLCVTKRGINSSKNNKNENVYMTRIIE